MQTGIAGAVATSGKAELIPDAYMDIRFNADQDGKSGYRTRAMLCCPIFDRHGGVIGVVQLINQQRETEEGFTQTDLQLVESFCSLSGIAIERACAYDELRSNFSSIVQLAEQLVHSAAPDCEYDYGDLQRTLHDVRAALDRFGPRK